MSQGECWRRWRKGSSAARYYKRRGWVTLRCLRGQATLSLSAWYIFSCLIHMTSKYLTLQLLTGDLATRGGQSDSSDGGKMRANPLLNQVKGCVNAFQWNQTCFGKNTFAPTEVKQDGLYCGSLVTAWLTYLLPPQKEPSGLWWLEDLMTWLMSPHFCPDSLTLWSLTLI